LRSPVPLSLSSLDPQTTGRRAYDGRSVAELHSVICGLLSQTEQNTGAGPHGVQHSVQFEPVVGTAPILSNLPISRPASSPSSLTQSTSGPFSSVGSFNPSSSRHFNYWRVIDLALMKTMDPWYGGTEHDITLFNLIVINFVPVQCSVIEPEYILDTTYQMVPISNFSELRHALGGDNSVAMNSLVALPSSADKQMLLAGLESAVETSHFQQSEENSFLSGWVGAHEYLVIDLASPGHTLEGHPFSNLASTLSVMYLANTNPPSVWELTHWYGLANKLSDACRENVDEWLIAIFEVLHVPPPGQTAIEILDAYYWYIGLITGILWVVFL